MIVTLQEAKTFLGITTADKDAKIQRQIAIATTMIEHYCHRTFALQNYTQTWIGVERFNTSFWEQVFVDAFPIKETTEVRLNGNVILPIAYQVFPKKGCYFFQTSILTDASVKENLKFEIDFSGGYETIPESLKSIVLYYIKAGVDNDENQDSFLPSNPNVKMINLQGKIRIEKYDWDRSTEIILNSKNKYVLDAYKSGIIFPELRSELTVRE